jgi:hypothetical protein
MTTSKTLKIGSLGPRELSEEERRRASETPPAALEGFDNVVIDSVPGIYLRTQDRGPGWHNHLRNARETYLREVPRLAAERGWDGVIASGAPVELLNPGLHTELQALLDVPLTTAMVSCAAALKAFGARRALLITGFFEGLDEMLYGYYAHEGIELVLPASKPFTDYDEASRRRSPDVFFEMARHALATQKDIDAVYFQGAIPSGPIHQRVETELGLPVVSGHANLWYVLSKLGRKDRIPGALRLHAEWPPLPSTSTS